MKLLITGANGFIGRCVLQEALRRGHGVVAMVRAAPPREWSGQAGLEVLKWDLSLEQSQALSGMGIDGVIHLAAALTGDSEAQHRVTVRGTENLIHGMQQAGISRLVGISSISVLDYISLSAMALVDESVSVSPDACGMGLYASLKLKQEALFNAFASEGKNRCTILRPGLVFDESRLIAAHAGIIKGSIRLLVDHDGQVPTIEVRGLARAILAAAEIDLANSSNVIHLVDDHLPGQQDYLVGLRRRGLLPDGGVVLPWRAMSGLGGVLCGGLTALGLKSKLPEVLLPHAFASRLKPFRFSNASAKSLLGWQPGSHFS